MTVNRVFALDSPSDQVAAAPPGSRAQSGGTAVRLLGIDAARSVAILGMFASHVGPTDYDHPHSWLFLPFHGRAAVLFAVLAGISIAIMSGGSSPAEGTDWRKALTRIACRATLMLALGVLMNNVFIVPVWVIITYYGGLFLLSLPFLRLGARGLTWLASAVIVAAPILSWFIRQAHFPKTLIETPLYDLRLEQLTSWSGAAEFIATLLLTGVFPTIIWIGFVFAGMAIGRLDLTSRRVALILSLCGTTLALLSYASSWISLHILGGANKIYETIQAHADAARIPVDHYLQLNLFKVHGTPPTDTPAWLLLANAHTGTPFDGAGSVGLSLAVIGACLLLQSATVRAVRPLAAVGAMSLTCYVGHLVVMQLLWGGEPDYTARNAALFILGAITFAVVWRNWYGQGPLEKFVGETSSAATRLIR